MKLVEDGRVGIRSVVLLVATQGDVEEPALREPREFALHGTGARADQTDNLGCVETPAWLSKQQREHALLRSGE